MSQTSNTTSTTSKTTTGPAIGTRSHDDTTLPGYMKTLDLSKVAAEEVKNKDIITILRSEHNLVTSLYKKFESCNDTTEKYSIAYNLIKLLSLHAAKEEMALYPMIQQKFPTGKQIVEHALKEHLQVKQDLYELDQNMNTFSMNQLSSKLGKTVGEVEHHVQEEEEQILSKLSKYLTPQEMTQVRDDFNNALSIAPSRPHPDAPNTPPQNKVVNAATMPADAARDAARFAHTAPTKSDFSALHTVAS